MKKIIIFIVIAAILAGAYFAFFRNKISGLSGSGTSSTASTGNGATTVSGSGSQSTFKDPPVVEFSKSTIPATDSLGLTKNVEVVNFDIQYMNMVRSGFISMSYDPTGIRSTVNFLKPNTAGFSFSESIVMDKLYDSTEGDARVVIMSLVAHQTDYNGPFEDFASDFLWIMLFDTANPESLKPAYSTHTFNFDLNSQVFSEMSYENKIYHS